MKGSTWLILLSSTAMMGLTGCSEDDNVVKPPTGPAAAEAAIGDALDTIIDPLLVLMEFAVDYLGSDEPFFRLECPDTSQVCNPGSLTCAGGGAEALEYEFSDCTVAGANPALMISGHAQFHPTIADRLPWGAYRLSSMSVNGNQDLSGEFLLWDECLWRWRVFAENGLTSDATFIFCQSSRSSGEYPLPDSSLWIGGETSAGFLSISFRFDGTQIASAYVSLGESLSQCTVDLETFSASCSDADI